MRKILFQCFARTPILRHTEEFYVAPTKGKKRKNKNKSSSLTKIL